jgi:large subunit ribosomal protein L17
LIHRNTSSTDQRQESRIEGDFKMRHRKAGYKLGRNTSHRRAVLRNLVTSVILNDRIETTVTKCKASRPIIEKMITLGKQGSVHARRQAAAYLMTPESVDRLFATVAPRYGARNGGYLRITRLGARKGDAAEMAYIELLGAEHELNEKAQKRADARAKKREELAKQMEERGEGETPDPNAEP